MLPETAAPVISCYLELREGRVKDRNVVDELSRSVQRGVPGTSRQHVADAMQAIKAYLAVAGTEPTYLALYRGQADVVVIGQQYEPGFGWVCDECSHADVERAKPDACPECNARALREFDVKGAMVCIAEQQGCTVETVKESETLKQLGGVGCLLRYRLPDEYVERRPESFGT